MPWRTSHHQSLLLVAYCGLGLQTQGIQLFKKKPYTDQAHTIPVFVVVAYSWNLSLILFVSGQDPCSFVCFPNSSGHAAGRSSLYLGYIYSKWVTYIFSGSHLIIKGLVWTPTNFLEF